MNTNRIPIEVSARHVHLSREACDALFGKNYNLRIKKDLSQPGQYLSEERVDIQGPRDTIKNVAVLGPLRDRTQVELSLTDFVKIGVEGIVRESGDLSKTPGCKIIGPCGEFALPEGLIAAQRHIHMTPEDSQKFGVTDGQIGKVKINSNVRSLIFDDVVFRVNKNFSLAMHIDTDEANALKYSPEVLGEIILSE